MLTILGAPFAGALALIMAFGDLIPVVGATIAAFLVGVVLLFVNFPVALIVWIIFAIVYQQVENYVIQPQIQRRAVAVEPIVILVAVLFGSTLFGVVGALLAIPAAASIQIAVREWIDYRRAVTLGVDVAASHRRPRRSSSPKPAERSADLAVELAREAFGRVVAESLEQEPQGRVGDLGEPLRLELRVIDELCPLGDLADGDLVQRGDRAALGPQQQAARPLGLDRLVLEGVLRVRRA